MSLEILNSNVTKSGILSLDNLEKGFTLIPDTEKTEYKSDKFINLNLLLDDIRSNNLNLRNNQMIYDFKKYISNLEQTYILDDNKNHIDISAKIGMKNGSVKLRLFGMNKPYMEVFFGENGKLMYTITFRYEDSMQTVIELKTDSFKEYKNMLLYLGYGDIEKDKNSSAFFIREFTRFLNSSNSSDDLYNVYGDIPLSLILKIQLTTEKVVDHLKILTKRDDTGFFSWAEDTSSLLVKVLAMFRKAQEVSDYFWKDPKFLIEIYDNLDGFSEPFGIRISNRIIFASILNNFVSRSKNDKSRISANTLRSGQGYFVESDILEANDTLNTIKGILNFDWDFDFKDAVFLQQKRTYKKNILRQDLTDEGKPIGNNKVSETVIVTEDIDPGYLYHPMHLVHFLDGEKQKANLVTALFIKAIADGKEWEQVMRNIRIGGDIFAIILGTLTLGSTSVLALTDIGLATVDLTLMNEDVKEWLSQSPEGKWFVENWDLIYGLIGAGIMSVVMIDGVLTYGPELLQKIKNLKNIGSNYRIFVQELEKLVNELEVYRIANPVENAIDEIKLIGDKNSIWKKVLNLGSSPERYIEGIVQDLSAKGLSIKKIKNEEYEIFYQGKSVIKGKDVDIGKFVKKLFWLSSKKISKEVLMQNLKQIYLNLGNLRNPARNLTRNEDVLLRYKQGLQSSKENLFVNVKYGQHGQKETTYLWTIDERGINIGLEQTPFPTSRRNIVHSNISKEAYIAGELWFISESEIIINAGSGRFGYGSGATLEQWNTAIEFWQTLGYKVNAVPFNKR